MRLVDLMKKPVVTVTPEDTVAQARLLLGRHAIRHLPVVEAGALVGIVTESDLRPARLERASDAEEQRLATTPVREVMTTPVASLPAEASAREAANLMRGRKIGCIPVVDATRLVGIVTDGDLLEMVSRGPGAVRDRVGRRGHGSPSVTQGRSRPSSRHA